MAKQIQKLSSLAKMSVMDLMMLANLWNSTITYHRHKMKKLWMLCLPKIQEKTYRFKSSCEETPRVLTIKRCPNIIHLKFTSAQYQLIRISQIWVLMKEQILMIQWRKSMQWLKKVRREGIHSIKQTLPGLLDHRAYAWSLINKGRRGAPIWCLR